MGKHETPPFNMVVERGRLVPATEYDAERLDTWRNGSKVNVSFVRQGSRIMERKWWAVLNRAVKECKTPWNTSSEASEAIKLALGIVNLSKTVGGAWLQYPKSLTELDDPELDQAVLQMIDVIYHMTGVNPEEWRKQIADIGKDEQEPQATLQSAEGEGSDSAPSPGAVAAEEPADAADQEAGEPEVAADQSTAPASVSLSDSDKAFLVRVFKTMKAAVGPDTNIFKRQALVFTDEIGGMSGLVRAKAKTIRESLQTCCGDAPTKGTVEVGKYLAAIIGVDAKEMD
jgi:hypothetical protein